MILIAEAGGTKTDWRLIDGQKVTAFQSSGFNLRSTPLEPFLSNLQVDLLRQTGIKKIYFYAAGVTPNADYSSLQQKLSSHFNANEVQINPDTLGACRAAFGHSHGWLGLLGTGSGLVYFNGQIVTNRVPSLGYVLGDEGSGADLGKRLIKGFIRNQFSKKLLIDLNEHDPDLNENVVLESVYQKPEANRFLSGFVPFIKQNEQNEQIQQILENAFADYFNAFFKGIDLKNIQLKMMGSVAYLFQETLQKEADKLDLNIEAVFQSPIDSLTKYHLDNG